jgi:lysophospholipase L1-like esterase
MIQHTGSEMRHLNTAPRRRVHQVEGRPVGPDGTPLLAVVGASFSAGVGAGTPAHAWPEDLARLLGWRVVVSADPGAGFVALGDRREGPFSRLARFVDFSRLDPRLIMIQGGHNDVGTPPGLLAQRVRQLIRSLHRQAPRAQLGMLTVFNTGKVVSPATLATDRTIITAARTADPLVLVFDPIGDHWQYPRLGDHLHPTPAGHQWIADQLAWGLRQDGVAGSPNASVRDTAERKPLPGS